MTILCATVPILSNIMLVDALQRNPTILLSEDKLIFDTVKEKKLDVATTCST